MSAMGGANTRHSNKEEEVNLQKSCATRRQQPASSKPHRPDDTRSRCTPSGAASPNTNTSFRDRRPGAPPLELEPQRRMTQPPAAQAAQGKLFVDHGRCTNIRGRRPGLKVKRSPLRQRRPSRQPRHTSDTRQSTKPCKQLLRLMKQLLTMNPEAAASTHIHHPGPLPR
jgi:hypothetical protein